MRNKLLHFSEPVCGFKLLNCLTGVLVKTHKIVMQSPEFLLIKLSMTRSIQIRNNNFILKNLIISSCSNVDAFAEHAKQFTQDVICQCF